MSRGVHWHTNRYTEPNVLGVLRGGTNMSEVRKMNLLNLAIRIFSLPCDKVHQMNRQLGTASITDSREYKLVLPIEYLGANITPLKQIKEFVYVNANVNNALALVVTSGKLGIHSTYTPERIQHEARIMQSMNTNIPYNQMNRYAYVNLMQQLTETSLERTTNTLVEYVHENYNTLNLEIAINEGYIIVKYTDMTGHAVITVRLRVL